jgi:hypothetical protein
MPYVPKSVKERAHWMTLNETLAFIRAAEGCSRKEARRQLGLAVADQEVEARWPHTIHLRWADEVGPPASLKFWKSALFIPIRGGMILDDPACRRTHVRQQLFREGELHFRAVLFKGADVERIWGATNRATEPQAFKDEIGHAGEADSCWTHGLDKEEVSERIRQEARNIYADPANDRPNIDQAERLIRRKLGLTRERVRPIVEEDEFEPMRRKRGQRKRKK